MRKSEIVFGSVILGVGVLLLLGALFHIDVWSLICPAGLIVIGVLLIYRTQKAPDSGNVKIRFVGDMRLTGNWHVQAEETWG
ncbi:MAG TPA: hypothetical protein DEH22_00460, partial [Chloroflexi bacterium]|nr:hypothetical protein [Chloroflexota bacterium]